MRRALFVVVLLVSLTGRGFAAEIRARVIASGEGTLTVDRGSRQGLRLGMRGTIQALDQDSSGEFEVNMGIGTIRRIDDSSAEMEVDSIGRGFLLSDARQVVFSAEAITPEATKAGPPPAEKPSIPPPKFSQNAKGYREAVFPLGITMIKIPAGPFTVGSPERDGDADEHPAHRIGLDDYWIGRTEVTFDQFDAFCRETGRPLPDDEGFGRGSNPVINVTWNDAMAFCKWLSQKTGMFFRLPSESEWEKAARNLYPWGSAAPNDRLANFNRSAGRPSPVGSFPQGASPCGALDMAGNVWEWTADWYSPTAYREARGSNPTGPVQGTERCVRGGSWRDGAGLIRSANRSSENPASRLNVLGFRLAMSES